jgi:hypothetical protein
VSIPRKRIDWLAYDQFEGSDAAFARSIGMDPRNFHQYKKTRHLDEPTEHTSAQDTALHSAEIVSVPDIQPTTVHGYALDSADTLSDHETRLQVLESFVATLQAQAVQPITVQTSAYALHSAEPVQTWDDPDDAKPERWNLWLPRGLKRRIEAYAKAAGIAPSTLVQRLLMSTLNGGAQ